jgi:hypothetical protein
VKKCRKGNSCGRSCISKSKICRKNAPVKAQPVLEEKAKLRGVPEVSSSESFELHEYAFLKEMDEDGELNSPELRKKLELYREKYKDLQPGELPERRMNSLPDYVNKDKKGEDSEGTKEIDEKINSESYNRKPSPIERKGYVPTSEELEELASMDPREAQALVYERRGFNQKPDVVESIEEIRFNNELYVGDDGRPMVMMRGVSKVDNVESLRSDEEHYVGTGLYGNGTYFAVKPTNVKGADLEAVSDEARSYGIAVSAAGLKKDANVWVGTPNELESLRKNLASKYGDMDLGLLMALEGYDAYLGRDSGSPELTRQEVTGDNPNYFVVLNRGALVVADGLVPAAHYK